MVHVRGNATTGYASNGPDHVALPQPVMARTSHRPWCGDCKRKHDADELDDAGRCTKCARAAVTRAEAEARRAERADEIAALEKAAQTETVAAAKKVATVVRRPTKPAERRPTRPTSRTNAPASTASTSVAHLKPAAGSNRNTDAQVEHAARLLRDTATSTHPAVKILRRNALGALEALHLIHGLNPATPTAAPEAPSPVSGPAPQTTAGPRVGEAPARRSTDHDPRRIVLPAADIITAYQAGKSLGQIADTHGVSAPTIRRCLIDNDIPRRRAPVEHTPELIDLVRSLYDDEHLTQIEIAERIGRSAKVVQNLMTAAGVDRRAAQARHAADNSTGLKARMSALGITSADVRTWAATVSRPMKTRGLPSAADIDAYASAHQPSTTQPTGDTAA